MEAVPQETVEKLMGNVPAQKELEGIRILASSPGSVRYEIDVPDNVLNYHGCLTVSADTSHKGRSTSVAHCAIVDERGRLVAESTFTMFFLGPLES